ncbi:MAG: hypothetical protein ABJN69_04255 [Hellea sp.]
MFGGLFSKKTRKLEQKLCAQKDQGRKSSAVNIKNTDINFLGDLDGAINGIEFVRLEIAKVLANFPTVMNAWFSKIQYAEEERIRLALIIDSQNFSKEMGHSIALRCSEIVSIDIVPSINISTAQFAKIKSNSKALYCKENKLLEIPILVERGGNKDMPEDWKQGIQLYYVAESEIDLALHRAAAEAQIQKFQMVCVFEDKILQLDPKVWWDEYVMERFAKERSLFPSQEDIEVLVKTGGLVRGICMQWDNYDSNKSFQ